MKEVILEKLKDIYCAEDAEKAFHEINQLHEKYADKTDKEHYDLSEKDVILITYGDQVHKKGEAPLKTLNEFMETFCKDKINSVHILPFFPYTSDDGFSIVDYCQVDPHLGAWSHIDDLNKNYRLMFDAVINHMSRYSNWFTGYIKCEKEYEDFFIDVSPDVDLSSVVRPRTSPLLTEFTDVNGKQRLIWTTFSADQVDLNYANYKVLIAVLDVLCQYVLHGAKLIRLDAIAFIWKDFNTSCIHLEQTHLIIQLIRDILHELSPETLLITETNVPHKENISYFGDGYNEAQMIYNFTLPPLIAYSIIKGESAKLIEWANTLELPSDKVYFFNFTASHDGCGLRPVEGILDEEEMNHLVYACKSHGGKLSYRSYSGKKSPYELNCSYIDILTHPEQDDDERAKRMLLSQAIILAMPGVPGIYFHSLVGASSWHEGVSQTGKARSINREKFEYDQLKLQLNDSSKLESLIYSEYIRLIELRINEPCFHPNADFSFPELHEHIFAIHRTSQRKNGEFLLALFNLSNEIIELELPEIYQEQTLDIIKNEKFIEGKVSLSPYQVRWLIY